jgi:hypothetical protein
MPSLSSRHRVPASAREAQFWPLHRREVGFHLTDERCVFLEHLALFLAEAAGDNTEILAHFIEHAAEVFAIFDLP